MPANTSPKRRPSRTTSRRSKILPSLPTKARPGLAVDTSISRHRAPVPQQVYPYESKTQELSFISLADIKALKKQTSINKARQKQLQNAQAQAAQRSLSHDAAPQVHQQDVPPPYSRSKTSDNMQAPAMHKRIQGLRPSPLDLSNDISPSDRAITIGISIDPNTVSTHSRTPSSPAATQLYPDDKPQRRPSEKYTGQEVVTPTIVITPAKFDFDFDLAPKSSPEHVNTHAKVHRPTSSIYSRHTNCMPADGRTPPVPPLPLFAVGKSSRVQESNAPILKEEPGDLKVPKRGRKKNLSVCTVFEEDQTDATVAKRMTSQSLLPTPRRSRGWWNVITSPFSAGSISGAFFWRSPPPDEDGDRSRMLDEASATGSDDHAGVIFTNRTSDDLDLRSAPPLDSQRNSFSSSRPRQPKRSDTAPGALDVNGQDGVNIYSVPYLGAAADYYNPHKNFPSIIMSPGNLNTDRGLDGWSPSQSVYRESRGSVQGVVADVNDDDRRSDFVDDGNAVDDQNGASRALDDERSPFSDAHASNAFEGFSGTHPAATADKKFFATPATEELRGASPSLLVRPEPTRNETQATMDSYFSPLTATPVIEDARIGTLMGPSVVDVRSTPGRTNGSHASGIGAVNMASRGLDDDRAMSEKRPFQHQRNDSYGLGIDTDNESMSEKSLFPPPKPLAEQPRLGTDRFGQLRIEHDSDREPVWSPWYRRFLWPLAGLAAAMLILLVVLLVLFVTQGHEDMPVQAQWVNLTGFPAMPTGVTTVIQPEKDKDVGGCVQPADLWSCAAPDGMKEDFTEEMPNFRFEVRFRNQTRSDMNSTDLTPTSTGSYRRSVSGASLANSLAKRSAWSHSLFAASPDPPSKDDMVFLGNTTDAASEPYQGEETPFYITLLNASALERPHTGGARLLKREKGDGVYPYPTSSSDANTNGTSSTDISSNDKDDSDTSTNAASSIPRPLLNPNGTPAPPQLYPLASAQPLLLVNRGQEIEHYGFYTYFDRSVYIQTSNISTAGTSNNDSSTGNSAIGADVTPNTPLASSNAVCIFSQTRMHVQVWTRKPLITSLNSTSSFSSTRAIDSTANSLTPPGSFPYAVTITLDRHGGDADRKGVYCYGLDAEGKVLEEAKMWIPEDRGFGGSIVNAAAVPGESQDGVERRDDGGSTKGFEGKGIDGGDGGCKCSWKNWGGN